MMTMGNYLDENGDFYLTKNIDEVDVVATFHRAVDLRHIRAVDEVQVVIGLIATIELHGLAFGDGEAVPFQDIVLRFPLDVHGIAGCRDCCGTAVGCGIRSGCLWHGIGCRYDSEYPCGQRCANAQCQFVFLDHLLASFRFLFFY